MQNMHIFALRLTIRHFMQAEPRGDKSIVLCKVLRVTTRWPVGTYIRFPCKQSTFYQSCDPFFYHLNKSQYECMKYVLTPTLVPHEWSLTRMAKESPVLQGKAQEHNYG